MISAVALSKRRSGPFHDRRPVLVFLLQCPIGLSKAQNIYRKSRTDHLFYQSLLKVALGNGGPEPWYIKGPPFAGWPHPRNSPLLRLRKHQASVNPPWRPTTLFDGERTCVQILPGVGYSGPPQVTLPCMVSLISQFSGSLRLICASSLSNFIFRLVAISGGLII